MKTILRKTAIAVVLLLALLGVGLVTLRLLDRVFPFPVERIADRLHASAPIVRARDQSVIAWRVDGSEQRRLRVKLADISPRLVQATIAVEDKRFRLHYGVDPVAMTRALGQNILSMRRVSGASTITMQTIRLLWDRPRTITSKVIEMFRAWQLERLADKDRILEIYLNLAPYGGNVVGAEAAARRYFGKSAAQLNLPEACLLAGLPQSPARYNPLLHRDAAMARRDFVIARMLAEGDIGPGEARRAWHEPLRLSGGERRVEAPHFAEYALRHSPGAGANLTTTLDPELQERTLALASKHAEMLAARGVSGPAAVVLSVADSSILAYVGNASPAGEAARRLDAALVPRQPGSLMKPFIFGLLAGEGRLVPSSRVYDLPESWANYSPRNMDREWRGEMSASEALRQSRNITAVKQLQALGAGVFADFMRRAGLEAGRPDRDGLALALGVKEQRLLPLVNAYAALARLGRWLPPRFDAAQPAGDSENILSPAASWLILSALAPPGETEEPRLVWKTGTSWNQLDAWAVVVTPEIVVGVWCGRLGRGGSTWVAGSDDSLPLALAIVDAANRDRRASWSPPAGVEFAEVCRDSGALPGWHCPDRMRSPILAGPGGMRSCTRHAGGAIQVARARDNPALRPGKPLRIVTPDPGAHYVADKPEGVNLPLVAEAQAGKKIYWFVDDTMIGTAKAGEMLDWTLPAGSHRLTVTDGEGATAALTLRVSGNEGLDL